MVSEQIVNDTVKRMLLSNIDEDTIVSTLMDIGIDEFKAKEIVAGVRNASSNSVKSIPDEKDSSEDRVSSMQNELQTQAEKSELHDTATHNVLDEHGRKIDDVGKKVDEVHKFVSSPTKVDSSVSLRLSEIEKKTDEISARTNALMDIMKKILETNRQILTELKSK